MDTLPPIDRLFDPPFSVKSGSTLPDPSSRSSREVQRCLQARRLGRTLDLRLEATRRDEKYQQIVEAEKNKSKVLEAKFQELFKKAKEDPITKPLKDIDLD